MSPTVAQHQFLSPALSQSQTRCTAFQQVALLRWCGLHFWNCLSRSALACLCCLCLGRCRALHCLCSALCVDLSGANTLSAHSGQIFMLSYIFIIVFICFFSLFFLSSCRTVFVVVVGFGLFLWLFFAVHAPSSRLRFRRLIRVDGVVH